MSREKFFEEVKANFPKISESADKEYFRLWGDFKSDLYSYSWFESLANALNLEMNRGVSPKEHQSLFLFIGNGFQSGNEEVKQAIDVAFVENLFWNVSSNYIEPYWNILPEVLQELYFNFHGRKPFKI